MRSQPIGDVARPEADAGGNLEVRDHAAADVAVDGFRADRQQGCQFLYGQQVRTPRQALEDIGAVGRDWKCTSQIFGAKVRA